MIPRLHTQAEVGLEVLNVKAPGESIFLTLSKLKIEGNSKYEEEVEIRTNKRWHLLSTECVSGTVLKYTS